MILQLILEEKSYSTINGKQAEHLSGKEPKPESTIPKGNIFRARIKALKCTRCDHLIQLPKLP